MKSILASTMVVVSEEEGEAEAAEGAHYSLERDMKECGSGRWSVTEDGRNAPTAADFPSPVQNTMGLEGQDWLKPTSKAQRGAAYKLMHRMDRVHTSSRNLTITSREWEKGEVGDTNGSPHGAGEEGTTDLGVMINLQLAVEEEAGEEEVPHQWLNLRSIQKKQGIFGLFGGQTQATTRL